MANNKKSNKKTNQTKKEELKVVNGDPSVLDTANEEIVEQQEVEEVMTEEEAKEAVTSSDNLENIENELKEEYKEEVEKGEEMLHGEATADIDMKELEEISEKYGDADSRLEQIVKENAPENLQEALTNEMNDIENIEKKLEEKVENLEKGMSQEQKRMINSRFTNLWGGVRYT